MNRKFGFVLLTHKNPAQIFRLVDTLSRLYGDPLIAIHHDQSKSSLQFNTPLSNSITLVEDYITTSWGQFSVIDGAMKAMKLLQESQGLPEWIFLLSESCYPIKPYSEFIEHLNSTRHDACMYYEMIDGKESSSGWNKLCWNRYCNHEGNPFTALHPCYAGEHWFHINRRSAEYLINHYERNFLLRHYYSSLGTREPIIPEESYYHTILANNFAIALSKDNKRYIDWQSHASAHPKTLTMEDFSNIISSDKLIARKFDIRHDPKIMDAIDRHLGL